MSKQQQYDKTKCAGLKVFATLAEAKAVAERKRKKKWVAYPCECGRAHIVAVGPSDETKQREAFSNYIGNRELLTLCRFLMRREFARLKGK